MSKVNFEDARDAAVEAAIDVGRYLEPYFGENAVVVDDGVGAADIATKHDFEAEDRLFARLEKFGHGIGFYGEARGRRNGGNTFWLVDSIGGTGHFLRGSLFSSVMISLIDGDRVVASTIHDFVNDRTFAAALGGGASCNGRPLQVSHRASERSYVAAEIELNEDKRNVALLSSLQSKFVVPSAANYAFGFTETAMGHFEGFVVSNPQGGPWDFAPGALLVQEAGGVVTNRDGSPYDYRSVNLIAAPAHIHGELIEVCREAGFSYSEPALLHHLEL